MTTCIASKCAGIVALVLLASGWTGCRPTRNGTPVHFVIPKGFTGKFKLVVTSNGRSVLPNDGKYCYQVPENGILEVRTLSPLQAWHQATAAYDDGQVIQVGPFDNAAVTRIALFMLSTTSENETWFLVGTDLDYSGVHKEPLYDWKVGGAQR